MTEKRINLTRRSALKKGTLATGALFVGGTAASGTAAAGLGDGRVLDYHLNNLNYDRDRGSVVAGHVHDASTFDNHGEWVNEEDDPVIDGPVGNAFDFDGDDYIDVDYSDESPEILENWTVAGWINPSTWDDEARKEWLSVTEDRSDGGFKPLDFVHEDGQIKHYRGKAGGEVMSHDVSSESGWHHMLVTQDRVGTTNVDVTMYFDGAKVDSNNGDYENMRPSGTLYLGTLARPDDKQFYWIGGVDEVRIYDRVLSGTEISDLATMDVE